MNLTQRLNAAQGAPNSSTPRSAGSVAVAQSPSPGTPIAQAEDHRAAPVSVPAPAKARAAGPVDALAGLKQRAASALFDRMGARFSDSAVTEDELRASA